MKRFSARKNAENFSVEELKEACNECHRRGVKLYVTLNTIIFDEEMSELAECVSQAAECGVDGLIIQDIGVAQLVREICPEMPIHASTQMTLNSVCGVRAAEQLGFSRVVVGRELSAEQIATINNNTSAELEVFVHGALCVSISGQCYMSSIFGGRSGNRGLCAQPCRLDFSCGERHNVISLKDSSVIPHLNELADMGISSFKIEGRMKRPEYVACATDACYKQLSDGRHDSDRLGNIFSRSGLTDSYFRGDLSDMQGIRTKEDVDNSAKALTGIKALYKDELPRFKADIHVTALAGEPLEAAASCEGCYVMVSGGVPQTAQNAAATEESIISRMSKLGGTQFSAGEMSADVDDGLFIPAAELNALRRAICEELDRALLKKYTPKYTVNEIKPFSAERYSSGKTAYRAEVSDRAQLEQALELPFELIYAPIQLLSADIRDKDRVVVIPPLFLGDCEEAVRLRLRELKKAGFTKGMAHTLGHAQLLREEGYQLHGGYRMNIINSRAAEECRGLGFEDITLSFEGTISQLSQVKCGISRGILAYGRLPLMAMRRCPIKDGLPCASAGVEWLCGTHRGCGKTIKDRRGNEMPVLCGGNSVELLNPDRLIMSDRQNALSQFDFAVLRFTDERDVKSVLDMYRGNGKPDGSLTRGLYFRGAE